MRDCTKQCVARPFNWRPCLKCLNGGFHSKLIEDVLVLIVTMTAEMMHSRICSLMLVDDHSGELRIAATQSLSEAYRRKPSLKIGHSISGQVVKEQRPIYVPEVTKEHHFVYRDLAKREGLCSLLSVPMISKGHVVGMINVYASTVAVFEAEEIKSGLQSNRLKCRKP